MNVKTRVSTLEARMSQLNGELLPLLLTTLDGESESEALVRNGINENNIRPIVWFSDDDVNL